MREQRSHHEAAGGDPIDNLTIPGFDVSHPIGFVAWPTMFERADHADGLQVNLQEHWRGEGTVEFHKARWEDLPTQYNIVNAFHELEVKEWRGASIVKSVGGKDLSDQRILR